MKTLKDKLTSCMYVATMIFGVSINVNAQTTTESSEDVTNKRLEFGVRFMPTISSFQMKTSDGNTIKGETTFGYGGGAFIGYNFTEHVGVQAELLYFAISQSNKEQDVRRQVNLRYVNIPLLLSLNTGKSKPINLNVVVGPQVGVSAGGDVKTTGGDNTTTKNAIVMVKSGDIGFAYGAGLDFGLNPSRTFRLGVGFRGVYGLFDISDDSKTTDNNSYLILDKAHVKTYSAYVGLSILL